MHLHEPSYEKDIPDSCRDNIPQVIYSTQNSQISQCDDRNCSTKTVYPSNKQFSKFEVNYEQSQVASASFHNVEDNLSDLDTHNEEELVVTYLSHCGALEDYDTSQMEDESRDIGTRSAEVIDIYCLTPENISLEQDNDSVIGLVKELES